MKSLIVAVVTAFIVGCSPVAPLIKPPTLSFPTPPASLMVAPLALATIKPDSERDAININDGSASDVKLSEVTKSVITNYTTSNKWREQLIALQEWIAIQMIIYP